MKRVAEKQLTNRDSGDHDGDEDPGHGFKKADDAALAGRVMKGLPKRGGGRAAPLAPAATAPPAINFFGSSPSSFALPSGDSASKDATPTTSFFGTSAPKSSLFGSTPSSTSIFGTTSAASSPPTPPSSTFKAFSSVISSGSPFGTSSTSLPSTTTSATPAATTSTKSTPPSTEPADSVPLKYYTNLRGLNVSLLDAISSAVEKDPFSDISEMLEQYRNLRLKVQKEYEGASTTNGKVDTKTAENPAPAAPKLPSMPAPPTSLSFGGKPFTVPSSTPPDSSSTTASSKPTFSPFTFPTMTSTTSSSSDKPNTGFSFTPPSSSPKDEKKETKPLSNPFSFGAPKPAEKSTGGADAPISSLPFKFGSNSTSNAKPTTSLFGSSDKPSIFGSSDGASKTSGSSPFGFPSGASKTAEAAGSPAATTTPSSGGAFGGLTPMPSPFGVGFTFGAPTPSSAVAPATASSSTTTPASGSGASDENKEGSEADGATAEDGDPKALLGVNPHDEEGAGEENEETVHAVRLKAYILRPATEKDGAPSKSGPGWSELGVGILRLKKAKDSEARRILLRNSTNGKININFRIYKSLAPSLAKKALTFIGHNNGSPATYCVRLPNEEQAKQLKEVLDREIAAVKAAE